MQRRRWELQTWVSDPSETPGALSLVRSRMRVLLATERGIAGGMGQQQALRDAGVAPNMTWKYRDQVGRYRLGELQRALSRLVRAESDQKGGKRIEPMWSLEQAIRDVIDG